VSFSGDEDSVGAFSADGADPAFGEGVHPWGLWCGEQDLDADGGEDGVEGGGVFAVAIPDQLLHSGGAGVLEIHDEVSGQLGGPGRGVVSGCAEDTDAAGGVLNDGEDEQHCAGQGSGFEEVGGEDGVCLAA
jgi:hypothetical protein